MLTASGQKPSSHVHSPVGIDESVALSGQLSQSYSVDPSQVTQVGQHEHIPPTQHYLVSEFHSVPAGQSHGGDTLVPAAHELQLFAFHDNHVAQPGPHSVQRYIIDEYT